MATIFKNPNLQDYFLLSDEVDNNGASRSFIKDYEDGKIIHFPKLKADLDFDFWNSLPTDAYPALKKLASSVNPKNFADFRKMDDTFAAINLPAGIGNDLKRHMARFYESILPIYEGVFGGYEYNKRKVVWRLTETLNENMHIDAYKLENPDHFARMFINLDTQPRIWQTSVTIEDIFRIRGPELTDAQLQKLTPARLWIELSTYTFGKTSAEWWDNHPRHVAYFEPGDVWIADSRQIAHQIFYGRRAISIDFSVPAEKMHNPERQYLALLENFRKAELEKRGLDYVKQPNAA